MIKLKRKIADWIYKNMSFPKKEMKHGNELAWMFKDNCPCCLNKPIETLSNREYHKKYPANNMMKLGTTTIYLCDYHMSELKESIEKYIEKSDGRKEN